MAENDNAQEKTEDATPKRLREAREKGQVPRSRELTTLFVMLAGSGGLLVFGGSIALDVMTLSERYFVLSRKDIFSDRAIIDFLFYAKEVFIETMIPLLIVLFLTAFIGPMLMSGWSFSTKAMEFKIDKLSPLKGLKRMFSMNALLELFKAMAKFFLISSVAILVIWIRLDDMLLLGVMPVKQSIISGVYLLAEAFIYISTSLVILAAIDVPYQLYDHAKKLRMSKQEVKDEYKEVEGKPEVKAKVKQLQRELARGRMMQEVPKADVVVTNPTHYSVAIKYHSLGVHAPIVLAKGTDEIAFKIREIADAHEVPIITTPILARALYHTTELEQEIPQGLYIAVAQVLAYVYQLKQYERGQAPKPATMQYDNSVPEDYQFD